ncbi:MAG: DUF2017 family protein [Acidimicrobiales bacterium]
MGLFRRRWVSRSRAGDYLIDFPDWVRALLVQIGDELGALLSSDHEMVRRVFPTAYPDDPDREAGYQAMVRGELIDRHREGIALLAETADADTLTEEQLGRWLTTVNALRLVLGTALDLSDGEEPDLGPHDEMAMAWEAYQVMSAVVDDIVSALSAGLPSD